MHRRAIWLAIALVALAAATFGQTAAASDPPSIVIGANGETAPVFSYADAIRERVFIPVPGVDQDNDGQDDRIAADIIRPLETDAGLKVPAIINASPYLASVGVHSQVIHTTAAGILDRFPLFYDNFFVPRGYAVILAEANGTGFSTGCPLHGGPGDIASLKAVIDWLQGRVPGYDASGSPMTASWDNGKAAMIGKSYDGTLANGVAATGVQGLTTIVPISAISSWYDYSRSNGIRTTGTHYPASLSSSILQNRSAAELGVVPPSHLNVCAQTRTDMNAADGDATGDLNAFWSARDYTANVANVHASVFSSNGLNDDNVRPDQFTNWWDGLATHNVPRKLWLSQEGHIDPFDYRRDDWVDTLHRWFDYWLYDVPNGIMTEPRVTIERSTNVYEEHADWPLPGTANVDVFLRGLAPGVTGTFALTSGGTTDTLTFTDAPNQNEAAMINNPSGSQASRLVFLSPVLRQDLHLSGAPVVQLQAAFNKQTGNLGALLVDYSSSGFVKPVRSSDGISERAPQICVGDSTPADSACYPDVFKPTATVTSWRVSKGILDAENRTSLFAPTPLVADLAAPFTFATLPTDYVFAAGHQIGVILVSNYAGYTSTTDTSAPTAVVTVDTHASKITLPVVGGSAAALASGAFTPDTTAPDLHLPVPITVEATGSTTSVSYTATATDDVDASPTVDCTPAAGSAFHLGTTTVTCTATDASNNVATGSFTVRIVDTTPPDLHLPAPITTSEASPAGAAVTYIASATDVVDPSPAVSCLPSSGSTFPIGRTSVHCTATDATGNGASGSFEITVADTTPPSLHLPASIALEASGPTTPAAYSVTATDIGDGSPTVSCLPSPGSGFPIGDTTVHCTAKDVSGNIATGSFVVTIRDTTPPALHLPAPIPASATSSAGAAVTYAATAADAVDPSPIVSCAPTSGSTFAIGTTTIRCTAKDATGNIATGSFVVTVRDTTPPELHLPAPITVDAVSRTGAAVTYVATATDTIDSSPTVSCTPTSGSSFAIGDTTVRCTATDAAGNASSGSFVVHIRGVSEELTALRRLVAGSGRGNRLAQKAKEIQASAAAGKKQVACKALRAFRIEITSQSGKSLTRARAATLLAEATRIARVLGC